MCKDSHFQYEVAVTPLSLDNGVHYTGKVPSRKGRVQIAHWRR